jgi:hypothetical protein
VPFDISPFRLDSWKKYHENPMYLIWFHCNGVLNLAGRQVYKHHHQILPKHATGHPDGVVSGSKMTAYNNPVAYSTVNTVLKKGDIRC